MWARIWESYFIYLVAAVTFVVFAILTPNLLTAANLINILTNAATVAIAAAGMTFAITGGGFDLSIGSVLALTTCVLGKMVPRLGAWGALGVALLVGAALGAVNGLIVTKLRIQTFVATLSTMIVYRGLALLYTGGRDATLYANLDVKYFTAGELLGVPFPIALTILVFLAAFAAYRWTPFGVRVRAGTVTFKGRNITNVPGHDIVRRGLAQSPEGRKIFPESSRSA